MRTVKYIAYLFLAILVSSSFVSCGGGKSKSQLEYEINDLHGRIRTLKKEIPQYREAENIYKVEQMENNLRNYQIQLDELNRQSVK